MISVLDIGNTRLKWRIDNADAVYAASDYHKFLGSCLQHGVQRVLVSCVAPDEKFAELWCELEALSIEYVKAEVQANFRGLSLAYQEPASLGVDRWLAMVASMQKYPNEDLIVVSAGTAITVDYLTASGKHNGGLIVAGIQTSAGALFGETNGVGSPAISLGKNWQPGDTTLNCVEHGYSALYRGFLKQALDSYSGLVSPKIIMTGGDGEILKLLIDDQHNVRSEPTLVLDGLSIVLN